MGIGRDIIYDLVFWTMLGGIIGARIFYIVISWDYFTNNVLEMVMVNRGGLAWQGGLLGGAISGIWFVKLKKMSLRQTLDLSAPYIALGQSIGRIGCFLNGCCFGKAWDLGIYCPLHQEKLHPTQLYETFGLFLIFVILKLIGRKPHQAGMVFAFYLWFAAIERFIVEFFRADHVELWLGLSLSQYISMAIFAAGIFVYLRFRK